MLILSFFIFIYPENFSNEQNCFFDYHIPQTSNRLILYCQQGLLNFFLQDALGRQINIVVEKIITPKNLYLVNISHRITDDLKSEVKIYLDAIAIHDQTLDEPLLIINEIESYQGYFNRSSEKESQDFEFGLGRIMVQN